MTRIGPEAGLRTCCKALGVAPTIKARTAMCAWCNGDRPRCPVSNKMVHLHIGGLPCPRGLHPDRRGIVTWPSLSPDAKSAKFRTWSGVPFPIRLYLYCLAGSGSPAEWIATFPGCGCVRSMKAAWLRLKRRIGVAHGSRQID